MIISSSCVFLATPINHPRLVENRNMSEQSSSDNTTSVETSLSRTVSPPSRPLHVREKSYTHVFPAVSTVSKPRETTTRRGDPHPITAPMQVRDENTRLLFGGLHWLLDASVQVKETKKKRRVAIREPTEPLSEMAITLFNARKDESQASSSESATTAAWIDGQRKTPPAPPF